MIFVTDFKRSKRNQYRNAYLLYGKVVEDDHDFHEDNAGHHNEDNDGHHVDCNLLVFMQQWAPIGIRVKAILRVIRQQNIHP